MWKKCISFFNKAQPKRSASATNLIRRGGRTDSQGHLITMGYREFFKLCALFIVEVSVSGELMVKIIENFVEKNFRNFIEIFYLGCGLY